MTGTKLPYLRELTSACRRARGCSTTAAGSARDGLLLLEAGYRVEFADFDNPSIEYLRWRLEQRGLNAPIHDLDEGVPGRLRRRVRVRRDRARRRPVRVPRRDGAARAPGLVNFLEPEPGDQDLHHELPIRDLLALRRRPRAAPLRAAAPALAPRPLRAERAGRPARVLHRVRMRRATPALPNALLEQREHSWYHVMELADGEVTDGWFDLRPYVKHYGIPERLDGMRVLEIGTWDGFWAFELERRGAAEVVALDLDDEADLDWPARRRPKEFPDVRRGDGFRLAKEIRGSKAERVNCSVYHATPEELGTFDLVFCGSVLIHLRDQLLALERMANLCTGQLILAEEYDKLASLAALQRVALHGRQRPGGRLLAPVAADLAQDAVVAPASTASSRRARST